MEIQEAVQVSSSPEWNCPPSPPSAGWPTFPQTQFPSDTDLHYSDLKVQAWSVGNQMQLNVVHQVKTFFNEKEDSEEDEEEDSVEDEEEDSEEDEEEDSDYLGFFSKLFQENDELRNFYLKNHENAEFGCLVCGGVGFIKRFKECVALVQHTLSISNTKKKIKAHRVFGNVLCDVLGWDINKLPSISKSIIQNNIINSTKSQEKITSEADNEGSLDKITEEKEIAGADDHLPSNGVLPVPEADFSSIATKIKENTPDIGQGTIEGSLGCHEAGLGNGSNDVGKDVHGNGSAESKRKQATGDEKLPTSDISNLVQEPRKEDGSGKNESEDNQ